MLPLISGLISFAVCLLAFPVYIRWLKGKQIGQYIREEGPLSHAAKANTPTMGGLCFLTVSTAVATWLSVLSHQGQFITLAVIATGIACGTVGFADDLSKLTAKTNKGLSPKARLLIELVIGLALGLSLVHFELPEMLFSASPVFVKEALQNSFIHGLPPYLASILSYMLVAFLVAACANAVNLHDGMDGLAPGTSFLIFATLAFIFFNSAKEPLAIIAASVAGSLLAFLAFNRYPASIFMGDTGSLYLGGILAALTVTGGAIFWLVPLTLIYISETLSVIAQVTYFKLTKEYTPESPMSQPAMFWLKLTKQLPGQGRRLFRMAPLHHHFEAIAADHHIPEWQVVIVFWFVQLLLCLGVLLMFSYSAR